MRRCFEVGMQRNGFTEVDHLFKVDSRKAIKPQAQKMEKPREEKPEKNVKTLALHKAPKTPTQTKNLRRSRRKSEQNSKVVALIETPKKVLPNECPVCLAVPKYYSEDFNMITCRQCSRIIKQIYQSKRVAFCTEQKKCKISPDARRKCLYCFMKRSFKVGIKMDGFDRKIGFYINLFKVFCRKRVIFDNKLQLKKSLQKCKMSESRQRSESKFAKFTKTKTY